MKKFIERIIGILDRIIPKDKNIIVFGANEMRGINGNVAALIKAWPNHPKTKRFKGYILSVFDEKFPGLETIDPRSVRSIGILLRAHTAVLSHVYGDLYWHTLYNGKRRRIINLWHGVPLKRIGPWRGWGKTTALISSSKTERLALAACTELPLESIFVTGFPRTDRLIKYPKKLRKEALVKLKLKDKGQKWILYTPTYRRDNKKEGYLHRRRDFSFDGLKKLLEKTDAYLLVRSHVNDPFSDFGEDGRIIFADFDLFPEIEHLYALADVLITDYSSSIFEYLNLNRPILGFAPDLEEYSTSPGLIYDYEAIFPGPIAKDWTDLQKLIVGALENPTKYASLREDRSRLFNQFTDGNSTERCIDLICDMSIN